MSETARTIIVTGGSRGIGAAISKAFHAIGDRVVIAGRNDTGLAASLGDRALFVCTDATKPAELRAMVERTIQWSGRLDVVINNVGASAWRPLAEIDEEFWHSMLDVNLKSVLFTSQAALPHLRSGGAIVNISSLAGKRGNANNTVYCAAKFGVNGVTQSLAKELGPKGIRVNAICPVYVRTEGLEDALSERSSPSGGEDANEFLALFARTQSALGVIPTAEQIASSCVFLASSAAGAITGQCLNVDCGVMPQ